MINGRTVYLSVTCDHLHATVDFDYRWFSFNENVNSSMIKFILTFTATKLSKDSQKKLEENFAKVCDPVLSKSIK